MRNRKSLLLTLAMTTVFGVGCQESTPTPTLTQPPAEIFMEYNKQLHRVVVQVKPGDVIHWTNVHPKWKLQSPCNESSGDICTIKSKPMGKLYSYSCVNGQYCDPEILIDDGTHLGPSLETGNTDSLGDVGVQIGCDDSKKAQQVEPVGNFNVSKGKTVSWEAIGDYSHKEVTWNLKFYSSSPSDLCTKPDAITKDNPTCVVKRILAKAVTYSIQIKRGQDSCTESQKITITPM